MTSRLNRATWFATAGLALLAAAAVYFATPLGIGVEYDAYFYLSASENLLGGHGFGRLSAAGDFLPLTHFPPLYPTAILASSWLTGLEPVAGARVLAGLLLGLNVAAVVLIVRLAGATFGWSLAAGLFVVAAPPLFERHLWAMSEPLFFLLLLVGVAALARYLERPRTSWLLAAATAAGLAYLTRYSGVALILSGALALFMFAPGGSRSRLSKSLTFTGFSTLLVLPWVIRNLLTVGNLTNRQFSFHLIPVERLLQAGRTLAGWLPLPWLPAELRLALVLVGLLALSIWTGVRLRWRQRSGEFDWPRSLLTVLALFAVTYGLLLVASLLFFDAATRLDDRILSPLYLVILLVLFVQIGREVQGRRARMMAGAAVLLLLLANGRQSVELVQTARTEGLGFQSRAWRSSRLVEAVELLPADTLIYSNEAFPLNFLTGQRVHPVPERVDPVLAQERPDYRSQLGTMRARMQAADGVLVLFFPESLRPEMPSLEALTQGLTQFARYPDGALYSPQK